MELHNDFYTEIEYSRVSESQYRSRVAINAEHRIFEGHFLGFKVTPGVVLLKMIGEQTARITRREVMLSRIKVAKFTSVVRPEENRELVLTLEIQAKDFGVYDISARVDTMQDMAFKGNLVFEVYPVMATAK